MDLAFWHGKIVAAREGLGFETFLLPPDLTSARAGFVERFTPPLMGQCRTGRLITTGDRLIVQTFERIATLRDGIKVGQSPKGAVAWWTTYRRQEHQNGLPRLPQLALDPESGRVITEDAFYGRDVDHTFRPAFHLEHKDVSTVDAKVPHLTNTVTDLFWAFGRGVFLTWSPNVRWTVLTPRD